MTESDLHFKFLREPLLAAHALNPAPVWLWSANADRILWANPTGAAIFDATLARRNCRARIRATSCGCGADRASCGNIAPRRRSAIGTAARFWRQLRWHSDLPVLPHHTHGQSDCRVGGVGRTRRQRACPARASAPFARKRQCACGDIHCGRRVDRGAADCAASGWATSSILWPSARINSPARQPSTASPKVKHRPGMRVSVKLGAGATFALLFVFSRGRRPSRTPMLRRNPSNAFDRQPDRERNPRRSPFPFVLFGKPMPMGNSRSQARNSLICLGPKLLLHLTEVGREIGTGPRSRSGGQNRERAHGAGNFQRNRRFLADRSNR